MEENESKELSQDGIVQNLEGEDENPKPNMEGERKSNMF